MKAKKKETSEAPDQENKKLIDACNKDIRKVLEKHKFDIEAEIKFSSKGIWAVPVLVKLTENE